MRHQRSFLFAALLGLTVLLLAERPAEGDQRRRYYYGYSRPTVGVRYTYVTPFGSGYYADYHGWRYPPFAYRAYYGYPYSYYQYAAAVPYAVYVPFAYAYPVGVPVVINRPAPATYGGTTMAAGQQPARIEVRVPDPAAEVCFEGKQTFCIGTDRAFESPPLEPRKLYTYVVTSSWTQDGKEVTRRQRVEVAAGRTAVVDFTKPR